MSFPKVGGRITGNGHRQRTRRPHRYPVADVLAQRGIPFGFVTSEPADQVAAPHHQRPVLAKPFFAEEVEQLLLRLAGPAVSPVEHRPPLPSKEDHPAAPDLDPEPLKRG